MVNVVRVYTSFLHKLMKLKGYKEKSIEINPPTTTLHFWVRSTPNSQPNKHQPALVLLHGFAGDGALTWQVQALTLTKHFPTIIIPDLLFFGASTTSSPHRSPGFQGDCLAEGLRVLGVESCVLVGFSYGGIIGFEMARNHPKLVAGLVVTGSIMHLTHSITTQALSRIGFPSWVEFLVPSSVEGFKRLLDIGSYKLPWLPTLFYKHFLELQTCLGEISNSKLIKMVNTVRVYMSFLHKLMKLKGYKEKSIEINPPTTTLHFWVRSTPNSQPNKHQPALVLLHGFAGDGALTWQVQALTLTKHFPTIIIPDLLFFGGSTTSSPHRSPGFQGDCLAEGLRALGVESCVLVGFSYGGMIGFEMARNYPELVVGLVVTDSVRCLNESVTSRALERIGVSCWSEYLVPSSVEGFKRLLDIGSYKLPWLPTFFYKHLLEVQESLGNRNERIELLCALVIRDEDVIPHHFQQTIHILWGEKDNIFTMEDADMLKRELGGATILRSIKKAGHLALIERPCTYNNCLKELLATYTTHA